MTTPSPATPFAAHFTAPFATPAAVLPPLARRNTSNSLTVALALASCLTALSAQAQDAPGIVGKNEWLYYRYELSSAQDPMAVAASVDLIRRINRELQRNGVAVMVAMVPLKVRIHPENLPSSVKLTDPLKGHYSRILKSLRDGGVLAADLNTAFLNSPNRESPMPLFFRQDTHWSAPGALVAAETLRDAINAEPVLKTALDATPVAAYKLTWATQEPVKKGDLVAQLPKGSPSFAGEPVKYFEVDKLPAAQSAGLTDASSVGITLLGSSYTHDWTKFPGSVSYSLQRDILSISIDASQGQWVGLHTYLRDDAFQFNRPKLLIWEMPERDMAAPPLYKWRDARYSMDNTEWLLQASALVQQQCAPTAIKVTVASSGLGANQTTPNTVDHKATSANDFLDITFSPPLERGQYLSASVVSTGTKVLTFEANSTGTPARRVTQPTAGDDAEHNLRLALQPKTKGFSSIRIYPGNTSGFSLKNVQVCSQPADLLS